MSSAPFSSPNGSPTRLLLVRHGQSVWNADGRWQGQADPALTELGERQAFDAARRIGMVEAVYASDLERAAKTAQIIAGQLGLDVMVDARLRERHAGPWEGHTRDEIEAQWPGMLESGERPEGYEDDIHVTARALVSLTEIAGLHEGGDVLIVTHGGVVRSLERHLGTDDGLLPNLGGRWVAWGPEGPILGDRVELIPEEEITRPEQI